MIDLRTHIEEALFSNTNKEKDVEKLSKVVELDALKRVSYDKSTLALKTESPWEIGSVTVDKGYNVILTRPDTEDHHRYAEFYLDFENKLRLTTPFEKIKTFENVRFNDQGTLIIESYPEKDFTKLFTNDCEIDVGEIWIRHCEKLESLKGWPANTKSPCLIITDCPKLQDISELPASPFIQIDYAAINADSFKSISKEAKTHIQEISIYKCGKISYNETKTIQRIFKKCSIIISV
jgi:hypothetical protein